MNIKCEVKDCMHNKDQICSIEPDLTLSISEDSGGMYYFECKDMVFNQESRKPYTVRDFTKIKHI